MGDIIHETDKALLEKVCLDSDREAYRTLYQKYYPVLVAYAEMFVRSEEAEDVVQDQLLRLWTGRGKYISLESLNTFLFTCVRNACLDRIRHNKVRNRNVTELWKRLAEEATDCDCFQMDEIRRLVNQALHELPLPQRRAFEMSRLEGKTYREIAKAMDVSEKTVEYRISKALARLQVVLSDYLPSTVVLTLLLSSFLARGNPCRPASSGSHVDTDLAVRGQSGHGSSVVPGRLVHVDSILEYGHPAAADKAQI